MRKAASNIRSIVQQKEVAYLVKTIIKFVHFLLCWIVRLPLRFCLRYSVDVYYRFFDVSSFGCLFVRIIGLFAVCPSCLSHAPLDVVFRALI